jgi:hypothetical protein
MRVGIGLMTVAFLVFIGGQSYAQTFPALPGMDVVARTTHSQTPQASRSVSAPATSRSTQTNNAPAPSVSSAAKSSDKTLDIAPILHMPGAGSLPIIKDYRTDARTKTATADLLAVLAAIGTATALGMLWAVRRRFERA